MNNVEKKVTKILQTWLASEGEIRPHFSLVGPSGSGKTHLIKSLCDTLDINFFEVNAAQLTKEGMSGNSLSKSLAQLSQYQDSPVLCFVDEFDKLFLSGNSNSDLAHEVTHGVQNEFLKILESDTTEVFGDYGKYKKVSCDNVLFVFAGAFNNTENIDIDRLREFGVKTEFLGRVPLVYNLERLSIDGLRMILENMKLLRDYLILYPEVVKKDVVDTVMEVVEDNYNKNTLGARMLHALLHQYFIDGGVLTKETVKKTTFQKTLKLED